MMSRNYIDFRGWRFFTPFICMGCGIVVSKEQWLFSRSCGPCDLSTFTTRRLVWPRCFAGYREGLKIGSSGDIPKDAFMDPADREKYPLINPPPPPPWEKIGELEEAARGEEKQINPNHLVVNFPLAVGKKVFIRTVTYHYTGRVLAVLDGFVRLGDAAWIADSGRFAQAIKVGLLSEVEPLETVDVSIASIVDIIPWLHDLPRKQI